MKNSNLIAIILFVFSFSCKDSEPTPTPEPVIISAEKSAALIQADNTFGLELFSRTVATAKPNTNTSVSPLSVSLALAMVYNGAAGETKTEMENAMKVSGLNSDEINLMHKSLVDSLKASDPEVVLEIANAIYYQKGLNVEPNFVTTNQKFYSAEVNSLNFSSPQDALKVINAWVSQKTHNKIPTIIEEFEDVPLMVLLNAVYFNGVWKSKFDPKQTHNLWFNLSDDSWKETPMMTQTTTLEYASNDLFSAINLPYGKGNFQMTVILPNLNKTTKDVIAQLTNENWISWQNAFAPKNQLIVTMPRFKFSWDMKLNEVLQQMGIKKAFNVSADFSGITKDMNLFISEVIHKTYIDVNENGTEAAAVTAIIMSTGESGPDLRPYFTVNRPFIFAISEKTTGAILFIGEITNPEYPI